MSEDFVDRPRRTHHKKSEWGRKDKFESKRRKQHKVRMQELDEQDDYRYDTRDALDIN